MKRERLFLERSWVVPTQELGKEEVQVRLLWAGSFQKRARFVGGRLSESVLTE